MSDSQHTRFVRLAADVHRSSAENSGTRVSTTRRLPIWTDHRTLFNQHQRRLHQILKEWPEPGVAVFALHPLRGMAGRLWLSAPRAEAMSGPVCGPQPSPHAAVQLRAGTVGRHGAVDLHLPHDEELSLRHLLVLVRGGRSAASPRIQALDLATPTGFQAEQGGLLRAVDANGLLVLRAASFSLVLVPTGTPPPWDRDADDPWSTLPPRVLVADERVTKTPRCTLERIAQASAHQHETNIAFRAGPAEPGPEPLVQPNEAVAGHLVLELGGTTERLAIGGRALDRGVILGRYARCSGGTAAFSDQVSRVHAVFLRVGEQLHLVDAGSTNGTFRGDEEVKCVAVAAGQTYSLGKLLVRWEPTH